MKKFMITIIGVLVSVGLLSGVFSYTEAIIYSPSSLMITSSEGALIGLDASPFTVTKNIIPAPVGGTNDIATEPERDCTQRESPSQGELPSETSPHSILPLQNEGQPQPEGQPQSESAPQSESQSQDELPSQTSSQSSLPLQDTEPTQSVDDAQNFLFSGLLYINNNMDCDIEVTSFQARIGGMSIATQSDLDNQRINAGTTAAIPVEFMNGSTSLIIQCSLQVIWEGGEASIQYHIPISGSLMLEQEPEKVEETGEAAEIVSEALTGGPPSEELLPESIQTPVDVPTEEIQSDSSRHDSNMPLQAEDTPPPDAPTAHSSETDPDTPLG